MAPVGTEAPVATPNALGINDTCCASRDCGESISRSTVIFAFADTAELESETMKVGLNVVAVAESCPPAAISSAKANVAAIPVIVFKSTPPHLAVDAAMLPPFAWCRKIAKRNVRRLFAGLRRDANPREPSDFIPQTSPWPRLKGS